jgi:hypothetical protein
MMLRHTGEGWHLFRLIFHPMKGTLKFSILDTHLKWRKRRYMTRMSRVDTWFATITYASSGLMFSRPSLRFRVQGSRMVWASMGMIFQRPGEM